MPVVGLPDWLVVSIIASVVLTVLANLVLRWRPRSGPRHDHEFGPPAVRTGGPPTGDGERFDDGPRVRLFVPWRLMIVVSLALTIAVNLMLALAR